MAGTVLNLQAQQQEVVEVDASQGPEAKGSPVEHRTQADLFWDFLVEEERRGVISMYGGVRNDLWKDAMTCGVDVDIEGWDVLDKDKWWEDVKTWFCDDEHEWKVASLSIRDAMSAPDQGHTATRRLHFLWYCVALASELSTTLLLPHPLATTSP